MRRVCPRLPAPVPRRPSGARVRDARPAHERPSALEARGAGYIVHTHTRHRQPSIYRMRIYIYIYKYIRYTRVKSTHTHTHTQHDIHASVCRVCACVVCVCVTRTHTDTTSHRTIHYGNYLGSPTVRIGIYSAISLASWLTWLPRQPPLTRRRARRDSSGTAARSPARRV